MDNQNCNQQCPCNSGIPNINNHLVLAILTTIFCCLPFGIVSIVYAVQVNSALNAGNTQLAQMNSDKAKFWGMLSLWIGIVLNVIGFFIGFSGAFLQAFAQQS